MPIELVYRGGSSAVKSVNGQTGDVVLTADDVGALPNSTIIPSIDGLATEEYVDNAVSEMDVGGVVKYDEAQELTNEQKAQARANIGATDEHINELIYMALGVVENGSY